MTDTTDDLDPETLNRLANTPLARLVLACDDVVGAADEIKQNQKLWDYLVDEVARNNGSRASSEETVEAIMETFLTTLSEYGELAHAEEEAEEAEADDGA